LGGVCDTHNWAEKGGATRGSYRQSSWRPALGTKSDTNKREKIRNYGYYGEDPRKNIMAGGGKVAEEGVSNQIVISTLRQKKKED